MKKLLKKIGLISMASLMLLGPISQIGAGGYVYANETRDNSIQKAELDKNNKNIAYLTYSNGYKSKITFLENGIFRFNIDPSGKFEEYAKPTNKNHIGRIQQQPDDSSIYTKPEIKIETKDQTFDLKVNTTTISFDKNTGKMTVLNGDRIVLEESEPIELTNRSSVQKIIAGDDEYFYGGGTQNGRFSHKGEKIQIVNTNSWVDGGVASPNPFYWSTKGYGVLRNTFQAGNYDFQKTNANEVLTTHSDSEFDAYYFISDSQDVRQIAKDVLNDYYTVTGNAVLLPEYGFYLGHLNCYNRDGWKVYEPGKDRKAPWTLEDGNKYVEFEQRDGYVISEGTWVETLNNERPTVLADKFKGTVNDETYKFSARAVIDGHVNKDMPLAWFLPNDGYGCGFGQNGYEYVGHDMDKKVQAIDANVENLRRFTDYANSYGVQTGLWTQSQLEPSTSPTLQYQKLRDFDKEVKIGGISTLKTDVAWVGPGYSFGLDGLTKAYKVFGEVGKRPNIITLDGWAGTQRYGSIWTGDQVGGNWEYIRFHIPTFIGQSLSGNPNIGSDMDGIFGGQAIIATRDFQFKAFAPQMLDMDGWGALAKKPYYHDAKYNAIIRMYLKLKAQMMPYNYTLAHEATTSLPMVRAMFLEYPNDGNSYNKALTQYQYMWGSNFLVAPVYANTAMNDGGDDVRNNIYLPDKNQIWIDYFSGKQYKGGQILNNYDAPIWKLPLFVKNGSIIPMYEENNNPNPKNDINTKGLDKTKRIVEFYPYGDTSFELFEDDGVSLNVHKKNDKIESVDYGDNVKTLINSKVEGTKATLTINKSEGTYNGYDSNRETTFIVNVSKKPTSVNAQNGQSELQLKEVNSLEEFNKEDNHNVFFYDERPNLNRYTLEDEKEAFSDEIITTPKLYVRLERTDVNENVQIVTLEGFENTGVFDIDEINQDLKVPTLRNEEEKATPTSFVISWDKVDGATSYEIELDGNIHNVGDVSTHKFIDLRYNTDYKVRIRARNNTGYSNWSEIMTIKTLDDPWRNVPYPKNIIWKGGDSWGALNNAFDHDDNTMFHSTGNSIDQEMIVDYGKAYKVDYFKYVPRTNAGNGNVSKMDIYISLDGVYWEKIHDGETDPWTTDAKPKTVKFGDDENPKALRYIKYVPKKTLGGFFSANGLHVYKKDGSSPFTVGSNTERVGISVDDLTNLGNYLAKSINNDPVTFKSQIKDRFADINSNDIYDVYDYAFTQFKANGGTKQTGKVDGNLVFLYDKNKASAGEVFNVTIYGDSLENVNAFGAILTYNKDVAEIVRQDIGAAKQDLVQNSYIAGMEYLSLNTSYENENKGELNIAFVNSGDKPLINGSHELASFKVKANTDIEDINSIFTFDNVMIIGPNYDFKTFDVSNVPTIPDIEGETEVKLTQSDFNITMTNEYFTEDDGTNVQELIQQKSYSGLFDNNLDPNFEFVWKYDGSPHDPQKHKLPATIHLQLKNPQTLDRFILFNRQNLNANGAIGGMQVEFTFEDDTKQSQKIDGAQKSYEVKVEEDKNVKNIDVTVFAGKTGDDMLTLSEIEVYHKDGIKIESISLSEDNKDTLYVGEISEVKANVVSTNNKNPYYTVESEDENVASIIITGTEENIRYLVHAHNPGETTLTFTAKGNDSKTVSYKLTVLEGVNTKELEDEIAKAKELNSYMYTDESYEEFMNVVNDKIKLLQSDSYTKDDIEFATREIRQAYGLLALRTLDESMLINTLENKDVVSVESFTTDASFEDATADKLLDHDDQTYWHNNYTNHEKSTLPQNIVFKLNNEFKLNAIAFLPHSTHKHADVLKVNIELSEDGTEFVNMGSYEFDRENNSLTNRDQFKAMFFTPTNAKFVRFTVLDATPAGKDRYNMSMAEVRFYGEKLLPDVDTILLEEKIKEAETLNQDDYEKTSWEKFKSVYDESVKLLQNAEKTQDEVDKQVTKLTQAINDLKKNIVTPDPDLLETKGFASTKINVRVEPNGPIIGTLDKGSFVEGKYEKGSNWIKFDYNGKEAYVYKSLLSDTIDVKGLVSVTSNIRMTPNGDIVETAKFGEIVNGVVSVNSPNWIKTDKGYIYKDLVVDTIKVKGLTIVATNVRHTPNGQIVGSLAKAAYVEGTVNINNPNWVRIKYNNRDAYIYRSLIGDTVTVKSIVIATLNVRQKPNGKILGTLKSGQSVNGKVSMKYPNWVEFQYKGQTAYVYKMYVK